MGFQTGTTIRPELGNADYSGFANAATIQANAMANLGSQIGDAITAYGVKKQKKDEKDVRYKSILPYTTKMFGADEGEKIARDFSGDPNLGSQIMQFASMQQDREALDKAIAVNTDTSGDVDYSRILPFYLEFGGQDPEMVSGLVKSQERSTPFTPTIKEVDGVTFAMTSPSSGQVIPKAPDVKVPTGIQEDKYTLDQIAKGREAYASGDVALAQDILTTQGIKNAVGFPMSAAEYYGTGEDVPPNPDEDVVVNEEEESLQDIFNRNLTGQ